jgi:hypothetical protein
VNPDSGAVWRYSQVAAKYSSVRADVSKTYLSCHGPSASLYCDFSHD